MKKLDRLIAINKLSQKDPKWIHKDIFRILKKDEIWITAYEKLKSNKGALTPGSIPERMDGMSLERLKRLQTQICAEKYRFQTLKLPTANDKIVQEVIRMILEAIYEPIFSELSFGFRSGLGCHDALHHVERKFQWVDYVVEADIEQAYPSIDHHILISLLEKRINDPRFIRLIWKLLRCGLLDEEPILWSNTGLPQASIASPILANIYYHELDEYVQKLKKQYESQTGNKGLKSKAYKSLEYKINKVSKEMNTYKIQSLEGQKLAKQLKKLRAEGFQVEELKTKVTRIEYVRYAQDWMIGVSGNRKLASNIKELISNFIKTSLAQKIHPTKTKITNIRKGNAQFLGYEIFLPRNRPISSYKGKEVKTIRRGQVQLRFDIPVNKITKRYVERGYLKQLKDRVRPISKASYSVLEDHVIVSHYRSVWFGLLNYYSGCTNRGRLQYIHYLLHISCAMTLGHRHRKSISKIFAKHGKTLSVKIPNTDKKVSFPYKTSWKLSERKWLHGKMVALPT